MRALLRCCLAAILLALASPARGAFVTYTGTNFGIGPSGTRTASDAASSSFRAAASALGTLQSVDFESAPLGNVTSLLLRPGLTVTLAYNDPSSSWPNITDNESVHSGFNTTSGGSRFLRVVPELGQPNAYALFAFDTPIQAFGLYLTGINGELHLRFDDGSSQSVSIPGSFAGGVQFFGFTDPGKLISSTTLEIQGTTASYRDPFGIDDLLYVAAPVPLPLPFTAGALGLVGLALRRRLRTGGGR